MTKTEFNKTLESIRKRSNTLMDDIQYKAIAYIDAQALHDNFDPIAQLMNTINNCKMDGLRANIRKYLAEYFPVKITFSKSKGFACVKDHERAPEEQPESFLPMYSGDDGLMYVYTFWMFNRAPNDKEQEAMNAAAAIKRFESLLKKVNEELDQDQEAAFWQHVAQYVPNNQQDVEYAEFQHVHDLNEQAAALPQ